MSRYVRKVALLAKIETVYGQDATPAGAANAILVSNVSATPLAAENVARDIVRPYFGASEQLVGNRHVELSFDCEIQSSGSMVAPTAPAWDPLVRACAFAAVSAAGVRVEYTPVSSGLESVTIYYYDDGVLHKLLGARGTFSMKFNSGKKPVFSFKFLGLYGGITAAVADSQDLTSWELPLAVTVDNTSNITFGCTYAAAGPTLTGGTSHPSTGLEITIGNAVNYVPLIGGQSCDISNREVVGKTQLELAAADEVSLMTTVMAASTQSMGFVHGLQAGYRVMVFAPAVQLVNPSKQELQGRRLIGFDARCLPVSGNDELRIVAC